MSDLYAIKFSNGGQGFEVQGPEKEWVNNKAEELKNLLETTPVPKLAEEQTVAKRTKKSTVKSSSSKSSTKKASTVVSSALSEKWTDDLPPQITDFVNERKPGFSLGVTKEAAILAVFLKDNLDVDSLTISDIEMIYRKMGWKTINHENQLRNAKNRDRYFDVDNGVFTLTYGGTQFGRDGAKVAEAKK